MSSPLDSRGRLARRLVALAGLLVPRHRRHRWRQEWEAEIWHYEHGAGAGGADLLARCLGAFPHALRLRLQEWSPDMIAQDVRYAFRGFFRNPGFTTVAVGTMALGIGSTVAIFSLVDSVVLAPLPYPASEELTAVWEWHRPSDDRRNVVNPGNFNIWDRENTVFEEMAALSRRSLVLTGAGEPEEIRSQLTTSDFFEVLDVEAGLGRVYTSSDRLADQPIVLSHAFWERKFGGDPDILGRTLTLDGHSGTVVGVLEEVFMPFGEETQLWSVIPVDLAAITPDQTGRFMMALARLADGATVERANAELRAIAERLEERYPDIDAGWSVNVVSLREDVVGDVRPALFVLLASVGLLLLVACANVANLLLARSSTRKREVAVRTSLGASGGHLARQLLTESLVLAAAGALLGVGAAYLGLEAASAALPRAFPLPRMAEAGVDPRVLLFATGATVVTGVLFGLAPAWHAASLTPGHVLRSGDRGGRGEAGLTRFRRILVVGEIGLSLMLLVGAGLLTRSFQELTAVDSGMEPGGLLTAGINLSGPAYPDEASRVRFFDELLERLSATPGVERVAMTNFLPLDGAGAATGFWPEDRPRPAPGEAATVAVRPVGGDYFSTLGIPLLQGRALGDRDRAGAPPVGVISRALAEQQWPGQSPVGKRLTFEWGRDPSVEVVGVVGDVRLSQLDTPAGPTLYLPYAQLPSFPFGTLVLRTDGDPRGLARQLEAAVHDLDPALPVTDVRAMEDVVSASVARPRVTALLMGIFAAMTAVLAAVGLYGVLSYLVSRRSAEMGIRMALGAREGDVLGLVLKEGILLTLAGILIGLLGAFFGAGMLKSFLFGVEATDPATFAMVSLLLLGVAVMACLIPGLRATRIDPSRALWVE